MTTNADGRKTPEQLISDLESKIAAIKARAERKRARKDPATRHVGAAIRFIDLALETATDPTIRKALDDARAALNDGFSDKGMLASHGSASKVRTDVDGASLLAHVRDHPGQRGEQIAAALGTDTRTLRPMMKRLIEENQIRTEGQRRGTSYFRV